MSGGTPAATVLVDLIAAQSPSFRDRGIARHGLASTEALLRRHPELVAGVRVHPDLGGLDTIASVVPPELIVRGLEPGGPGDILHLTSVFELEVPIGELWPIEAARRRMPLIVTVYDLIPEIFPEQSLRDPGIRRLWRSAKEIVRAADHVLAISESTAEDVARLVGVPEDRITDIGAGCDDRWCPPADREAAGAAARAAVDGLTDRYVVYNGSINHHKNVERLIEAYALLPEGVRSRWQLVVVCSLRPLERNHFLVCAKQLGVEGRVVLPGFVDEGVLVELYQGADLSVFPSLYEGYGLPVVEALACGAPVIAADNSSLRELLPPEARFDGYDPVAMAEAVERALTDEAYRGELLACTTRSRPTWEDVADRIAGAYERVGAAYWATRSVRPGWPALPRVAVVAPPAGAGEDAAQVGRRLVEAVAEHAGVDLYAPGAWPPDGAPSAGVEVIGRPEALPRVAPWRGGYAGVVVCVGPGEAYAPSRRLLARLEEPVVVTCEAQGDDEDPVPAALAALGLAESRSG